MTPSFNSEQFIDRTIQSVASQSGDFFLRYHVQDGGSTDATIERLKWWDARFKAGEIPIHCAGLRFTYESCPDGGMYDAICKALRATNPPPEAFVTWINSDDTLTSGSCAAIATIAQQFDKNEVAWVAGQSACVSKGGVALPDPGRRYVSDLVAAGAYENRVYEFVQQEGCFFRRWLWDAVKADDFLNEKRLAGDWHLWKRMAGKAALYQVEWPLGLFYYRENQLSADLLGYFKEIDDEIPFADRVKAYIDRLAAGGLFADILRFDLHEERWIMDRRKMETHELLSRGLIFQNDAKIRSILSNDQMMLLEEMKFAPEQTEQEVVEGYRAITPYALRQLVESKKLGSVNYKAEFLRNPLNFSYWRPLLRYSKRRGRF